MKVSILAIGTIVAFIAGGILLASCGNNDSSKSESTEQHEMGGHNHQEMASTVFSCPMHPEITGKKGEKCSKCGMTLVAAKNTGKDKAKMNMTAKASCPMHPEITGKVGDKCSKCGMALVLNKSKEQKEGALNQEN